MRHTSTPFFRSTFFAVVFLFFSSAITAQINYNWAHNLGNSVSGKGTDYGWGITSDAMGNAYITGNFQDSLDADPGSSTSMLYAKGQYDIFVAKYSTTGIYKWGISMGGTNWDRGTKVAVDDTGNVYVTGNFNDTVDFDPGIGTYTIIEKGYEDAFVAKYDSSGNFKWAFSLGSPGGGIKTAYGNAITVDKNGDLILSGQFGSTVDFDPGLGTQSLTTTGSADAFIAKYSAAGIYQWAFGIPSTGTNNTESGVGIVVDANNNIYVAGSFIGTADFDPSSGTSTIVGHGTQQDIFVAKYSSSGAYQWALGVGNNGDDRPAALAIDGSNNVYVTGHFQDTVDFDPGTGIQNVIIPSGNSIDIFVAKYSSTGTYQWAFGMGSSSPFEDGYGIAADGSNSIYVTGAMNGTIDADPGSGTYNIVSHGSTDIFMARYTSSGTLIDALTIGGPNNDIAYGLSRNASGNIYLTGVMNNTADFDPGSGTQSLTSNGGYDIFVAKYSAAPVSVISIESPENLFKITSAYPMPAKDQLYYTVNAQESMDATIQVYNVLGELMHEEKKVLIQGSNHLQTDIFKLGTGNYLLKIFSVNGKHYDNRIFIIQ